MSETPPVANDPGGTGEARAVARLQEIAVSAAKTMGSSVPGIPPPMSLLLVVTRDRIPRGERVQLLPHRKSPRGEILNVKANGERYDICARYDAVDVLAFCMVCLDELGAPCPVVVVGPGKDDPTP